MEKFSSMSKSLDLIFHEELEEEVKPIVKKYIDIAILVKYTQRVYSENFAKIDIKSF